MIWNGGLSEPGQAPVSGGAIMDNKWKYIICLTFLLLTVFFLPTKAYAHGAAIEYTSLSLIHI